MEGEFGATELVGQVTFRRPLSKRLLFFDLAVSAGSDHVPPRWVELLVKAEGAFGRPQDVRDIRDSVKLGDTVRAVGVYEEVGGDTFIVRQLVVVERWRDRHPATPFLPRPAPQRGVAAHGPQGLAAGASAPGGGAAVAGVAASAVAAAAEPEGAASGGASARGAASGGSGGGGGGAASHMRFVGDGAGGDGASCAVDGGGPEGRGSGAAGAAAAAGAGVRGGRPTVCKYWAATGRCPKGGGADGGGGGGGGGTCRYDHPPERRGAAGAQQVYIRSRRSERLAAAADQGFVHEAGDAAKRRRAAVFAEWLVQTYGREFLNSGTGVLDVAGGRGALTYHLLLHCGVAATLVEPRTAKLSRVQHRELAGVVAAATSAAAVAAGSQRADAATGGLQLPQLRRRFEPPLWRWDSAAAALAPAGAGDDGGNGDGDAGGSCVKHSGDGHDDEGIWVRELLAGCSMVVGLHPDQATEAILDFALECGKPFAIVPCCVFPRLFPHRRLRLPPGPMPAPVPGAWEPEAAEATAVATAQAQAPTGRPESQLVPTTGPTASSSMPLPPAVPSSTLHRWVPVESYPQLLEYLLQRAQLSLHDHGGVGGSDGGGGDGGGAGGGSGDGGGGGREAGGGGGAGRGEGHDGGGGDAAPGGGGRGDGLKGCGGVEPSRRQRQCEWLRLWRLAAEQRQQQQQAKNPDLVSTPRPAPDPNRDPDQGLDLGLVSCSLRHGAAVTQAASELSPAPPELEPSPGSQPGQPLPPQSPLLAPPPPSSGAAATLVWLEAQGAQWDREASIAGAGAAAVSMVPLAVGSRASATSAAGGAAAAEQGTEAGVLEAAAKEAGAQVGPGAGSTDSSPAIRPHPRCQGPDGAGAGEGARAGLGREGGGGGACGGPGGGASVGLPGAHPFVALGPAGVARLTFLGANQVVYRLPTGDGV